MNLVITKPNTKGQIVIPKKFRDELGIDHNALLSVAMRGRGVYISLVNRELATKDSKMLSLEILKKTAGTWGRDTWSKTKQEREKIELGASKKRKQAW